MRQRGSPVFNGFLLWEFNSRGNLTLRVPLLLLLLSFAVGSALSCCMRILIQKPASTSLLTARWQSLPLAGQRHRTPGRRACGVRAKLTQEAC